MSMCMFKSGILFKDRVYVPDGDSHIGMLIELGIEDSQKNAENLFLRYECFPKDGDVFSDIDTWEVRFDQDIRPEWVVEEYDKTRARGATKDWSKDRIYIGVDGLTLTTGKNYCLKDCNNITLSGDCHIRVLRNSQVGEMSDSSQVGEMCGSSTVVISDSIFSKVDVAGISMCDDSVIKDDRTKTIYQCGGWKLETIAEKEE